MHDWSQDEKLPPFEMDPFELFSEYFERNTHIFFYSLKESKIPSFTWSKALWKSISTFKNKLFIFYGVRVCPAGEIYIRMFAERIMREYRISLESMVFRPT